MLKPRDRYSIVFVIERGFEVTPPLHPLQSQADHLAYLVALKVHELAGGIGERPSPPKC